MTKNLLRATLVAIALIAGMIGAAAAEDKAGENCQLRTPDEYRVSMVGNIVLTCIDGVWKQTGTIGTEQLRISVVVMDADKHSLVETMQFLTLSGQPVPHQHGQTITYLAEAKKIGDQVVLTPGSLFAGFTMITTPTAQKDGSIGVELAAERAVLLSLAKAKSGDLEIDLPHMEVASLRQSLVLQSGTPATLPLQSKGGAGYTLTITAERL